MMTRWSAWSYRELNRRSKIVAGRLRRLGLQPGDRLLVWSRRARRYRHSTASSPGLAALRSRTCRHAVAVAADTT